MWSALPSAEPVAPRRRPTGMQGSAGLLLAGLLSAATACAGGSVAPSERGTVSGIVLSAPSCPVERSGTPCPPRVVPGAEVTARHGAATVSRVRAGADGRFTIGLEPGSYTIVARAGGGIGSTASADVTVAPGRTADVTLTVDSGIR